MEKCKNCGREIKETSQPHRGYGAGSGEVYSVIRICPLCNDGCYMFEKDDIPGFREKNSYPCCKCNKEP